MKKPIIKTERQLSTDPSKTAKLGVIESATPINDPMADTNMLMHCFARAIRRDVILSDTLAQKNPFKPGTNPSTQTD